MVTQRGCENGILVYFFSSLVDDESISNFRKPCFPVTVTKSVCEK